MGLVEKYGVLILAILIGGGFLIGPMASYAGLTGGNSNPDNNDGPNVTLPSSNYAETPFSHSVQEQLYMAARDDVVFVTGYYNTSAGLEQVRSLQSLQSSFGDRLYLRAVNTSVQEPPVSSTREVTLPAAIVVGGSQSSPTALVNNVNSTSLGSAVCDVIRTPGDSAAFCFG